MAEKLIDKDYLEIIDMHRDKLRSFSKSDLIDLIHHQAAVLHELEIAAGDNDYELEE